MPKRLNWEQIGYCDYPGLTHYPYRDKYSRKDEHKYLKGRNRAAKQEFWFNFDRHMGELE